jgi:hypothetical protein
MDTDKAFSHVLGTGLGKDRMWQAALDWRSMIQEGAIPFPTDDDAPERDALFAAEQTILHRERLPQVRGELGGIIVELLRRCEPLTQALKLSQPEHAAELRPLNIGAVAVLCLPMGWPDWSLAWHHTVGFDILGPMPTSEVLLAVDKTAQRGKRYAATASEQDVLDFSPHMREKFSRAPLDDEQQFL